MSLERCLFLRKRFSYSARGRTEALMRYCDEDRLEIDNNAERSSRAVSRKNYLFAGPDRGGESAQRSIDPGTYWRASLNHPINHIEKLLP